MLLSMMDEPYLQTVNQLEVIPELVLTEVYKSWMTCEDQYS